MTSDDAPDRLPGPLEWLLRDRVSGGITIAQFPNPALWTWLVATVLGLRWSPTVVGGPETGAAPAGGHRVRIVHREAGAHQRVDVVDLRAAQQVDALGVDVDLDPRGLRT